MPHRRPTLADVAAEAGVSKAAVSRVINDAPGVAPPTREHVRQVIARLSYRPDPVARALASGHGDLVELVVVDEPSVFGDSVIAACTTPPLTSVRQPVERMAAAATRALVDRRLAPHWRCVFPADLQIRGSFAAAPAQVKTPSQVKTPAQVKTPS